MSGARWEDFVGVTLEDGPLVRRYASEFRAQSCMFNFVHIYTRTARFGFRYLEYDRRLILYNSHFEKLYYPLGRPIAPSELFALSAALGRRSVHFVPESYVIENPNIADFFEVQQAPGEREYVYSTAALGSMAGAELRRKRESISRFMRVHPNYSVRRLGAGDCEDCLRLAQLWMSRKPEDIRITWEYESLSLSLQQFETLGLDGLGIFVDGQLVAYDIFSGGVSDLASCSFEKYDNDVRDCIPFLRREIGRYLLDAGYRYMNFGRDISVSGLEKSKASYNPRYMLNLFTLIPREAA